MTELTNGARGAVLDGWRQVTVIVLVVVGGVISFFASLIIASVFFFPTAPCPPEVTCAGNAAHLAALGTVGAAWVVGMLMAWSRHRGPFLIRLVGSVLPAATSVVALLLMK